MKENKYRITVLAIILMVILLSFYSLSFSATNNNLNETTILDEIKSDKLEQKFEGNFKEVSVKNLLFFITSQLPYNFIIDVDEGKKISISFKNTTIREAIKSVAKFANLEIIKINKNTILIVPKEKSDQYKNKQKISIKLIYTPADYVRNIIYNNFKDSEIIVDNFSNSLVIDAPIDKISSVVELIKFFDKPESEVKTKVFKLNNAKAKDILPIITNSIYIFQNPVIKEQIKIDADERTNSIVVSAPKFVIDNVENLLSDIVDKKLPQVMIDVQVIEINKDKMKDLGIYPGEDSNITTLLERTPTFTGQEGSTLPTTPQQTVTFVESDRISFPFRTGINLRVLMLEKQGLARVLANPKLMTSDGKTAKVFLGDRVPYIIPQIVPFGNTSAVQQSVQFVDVGLTLEFQPLVTKDGYINLKINPKVSYLVRTDPAPWTASREVSTDLTVKSEDTIVIAGLIKEEERKTNYKIPLIGDIPIVGTLFKADKKSKTNTEVIFIIKPKIINLENDTISNQNLNQKLEQNKNINQ